MSAGSVCKCSTRSEAIKAKTWRVYERNYNQSAFNGYHLTGSDYSSVVCLRCGKTWRTRAAYVFKLPDGVLQ